MNKAEYLYQCAEHGVNPNACFLGEMLGFTGAKPFGAAAPIYEAAAGGGAPMLARLAQTPLFNNEMLRMAAMPALIYGISSNNPTISALGLAGMLAQRGPLSRQGFYRR